MTRSTPSSPTSSASAPPRGAGSLVMAKYPSPGSVKTRLAAAIGAAAACRLYAAFVRDLAERLEPPGSRCAWAFWPPDAPFAVARARAALRSAGRRRPGRADRARDAGCCRDIRRCPSSPSAPTAPHLDLAALARGGRGARRRGRCRPRAGRGRRLLPDRAARAVAALFRDVAWGSSGVLEATLARAATPGCACSSSRRRSTSTTRTACAGCARCWRAGRSSSRAPGRSSRRALAHAVTACSGALSSSRRTASACGFPFFGLCPTMKLTAAPGLDAASPPSGHWVTWKKSVWPSP